MRSESFLSCLVCSGMEWAQVSFTNPSQKQHLLPVWFEEDRQNSSKAFREILSYQDFRYTNTGLTPFHFNICILVYICKSIHENRESIKNQDYDLETNMMAEGMAWVPELTNLYLVKKIYYRK